MNIRDGVTGWKGCDGWVGVYTDDDKIYGTHRHATQNGWFELSRRQAGKEIVWSYYLLYSIYRMNVLVTIMSRFRTTTLSFLPVLLSPASTLSSTWPSWNSMAR